MRQASILNDSGSLHALAHAHAHRTPSPLQLFDACVCTGASVVVFKSENGAAYQPAAAGGVAGAYGGAAAVKSEPGAGSVSQEVMRPRCSSSECQKHRLREVERGTSLFAIFF